MPFLLWVLSHLTSLNLFVDRYFIPKEAAIIFLFSYACSVILSKLPQQNSKDILTSSTFALCLLLIIINVKRAAFGLDKDTNYHHSLIIKETYPNSEQPIIVEGDPKYFPNAYLGNSTINLWVIDSARAKTYKDFQKKIEYCKYQLY